MAIQLYFFSERQCQHGRVQQRPGRARQRQGARNSAQSSPEFVQHRLLETGVPKGRCEFYRCSARKAIGACQRCSSPLTCGWAAHTQTWRGTYRHDCRPRRVPHRSYEDMVAGSEVLAAHQGDAQSEATLIPQDLVAIIRPHLDMVPSGSTHRPTSWGD